MSAGQSIPGQEDERPDLEPLESGPDECLRAERVPRTGRADHLVAQLFFPEASRRHLAELFARGAVRTHGRRVKKGEHIPAGTSLEVWDEPVDHPGQGPVPASHMALEVLHMDADLVIVNKPGHVASHPLRGGEGNTLANALVARFPECVSAGREAREAGLVHRLDRGTTGILIAARNARTHAALRSAFSSGRVEKTYWAVIERGDAAVGHGRSDLPLVQRGPRVRVARERDTGALEAATTWRVLERFTRAERTLLECRARTGRTHQVRVHLAHALAPIVADIHYGGHATRPEEPGFQGFFLHAERITLTHPSHGMPLTVAAPLPADRTAYITYLREEHEIP